MKIGIAILSLALVTGCAGVSERGQRIGSGAVIGGVVGHVLGGGSGAAVVGGAVLGGVVGDAVDRDARDKRDRESRLERERRERQREHDECVRYNLKRRC